MAKFVTTLFSAIGLPGAQLHWASVAAALLLTYLACHPILAFARRGWAIKRDDVLSSLNDSAKTLYLQTFLKKNVSDPAQEFDQMYTHRYGRYRLIAPTILFVLVLLPVTYLVSDGAMARIAIANCGAATCPEAACFFRLPSKAVAALSGSYTWVVYGLIMGSTKYDLSPQLLISAVLRIVVAAPLGYAVGALAEPGFGVFLAFTVGAFPLATIKTLLQRIATKKLNLDMGVNSAGATSDQVPKLNGVDAATADRLQDADITTVAQLAYCDPVQVAMRTNMAFDVVLDLVSQALAWIYLEDKLDVARKFGMRGALEIAGLYENLSSDNADTKAAAEGAFASIAAAVQLDPDGLKRTFMEIAGDPYTNFLASVWNEAMV